MLFNKRIILVDWELNDEGICLIVCVIIDFNLLLLIDIEFFKLYIECFFFIVLLKVIVFLFFLNKFIIIVFFLVKNI